MHFHNFIGKIKFSYRTIEVCFTRRRFLLGYEERQSSESFGNYFCDCNFWLSIIYVIPIWFRWKRYDKICDLFLPHTSLHLQKIIICLGLVEIPLIVHLNYIQKIEVVPFNHSFYIQLGNETEKYYFFF
jgi:hypothetical protein